MKYGWVKKYVAFQETQLSELTQDMECLIPVIDTQLESLAIPYSDHDQEIDEEMTMERIQPFLLLQDQVTQEGQGT